MKDNFLHLGFTGDSINNTMQYLYGEDDQADAAWYSYVKSMDEDTMLPSMLDIFEAIGDIRKGELKC